MPVLTQPIDAELKSVWDGDKTFITQCLVDPVTGVITLVENEDEEERCVQKLDHHTLIVGLGEFNVNESSVGVLSVFNPEGFFTVREAITTFEDLAHMVNLGSLAHVAGNPAANTWLTYTYRDWAYNTKHAHVVFPGAISLSQLKIITENLPSNEGSDEFLPRQVDLNPLCPYDTDDNYDLGLDHCVHTIIEFGLTLKAPTDKTLIDDFVSKFVAIGPDGWDKIEFGNIG